MKAHLRPSLEEQIEAVRWARELVKRLVKPTEHQIFEFGRRLDAAIETLEQCRPKKRKET